MKFRKFFHDTAGNVATMFALGAVGIFGVAGVALDMVRSNDMHASMNAAADAAVLAAVASVRTSDSDTPTSDIIAAAETEAQRIWNSNLTVEQKALLSTTDWSVTKVGEEWTASVTYKGKLKNTLMAVLGVKDTPLAGHSVATTGTQARHWNFSFVVDTSSSMGIGATQADMNAMQADPNIGCMFACHYSTTGDDTVARARTAGYKLRLDVVDEAVDTTIAAIGAKTSINPKVALYGMTTDIAELVPLTASLNSVKNHDIQVAFMAASIGNTNYRAVMESVTTKIGPSGDGTSASKARDMVFIITDGIHDAAVAEPNAVTFWGSDHQLGTIDPAMCESLKTNGALVGVLYIDYIVPGGYESAVSDYQDTILPKLEQCASPGFFHNATSSAGITTALGDMLEKAFMSDARLTQ